MSERCCGIIINGHHTDIVLRPYSNRTLLIVTQFEKFGTLLMINRESFANHTSDVFKIKTLFGFESTDILVAGRYIAQKINIEKPLLLSIALKDYNVKTIKAIVAAVDQIKPW